MTYKYDCHFPDRPFDWRKPNRRKVALHLALGHTQEATAERFGISRKTIVRWKAHPEFQQEIDRLSLLIDIASRAERVRIAMRVVRDRIEGEKIDTDRDLLDWLKFVQSETDGINIDIKSGGEPLKTNVIVVREISGDD